MDSMKRVLLSNSGILRIATLVLFFALPIFAGAQGLVPCGGSGQDPCELCHIFVLFDNIVRFILTSVVPPIAVFMLIFGGIMFYVSAGDVEKATKARRLITSTIVGMMIVYFAWGIVVAVFTALGAANWVGDWGDLYNIPCPLPSQ